MSLVDLFPVSVVKAGKMYVDVGVFLTVPRRFSSDNGSVYHPNYHVVCEKGFLNIGNYGCRL